MAHQKAIRTRPPSVLEDPSARAIAQVYATAFLGAATSTGLEGAIEEFGSFQQDVLERQPEFTRILSSRVVSRDDKLRLIDRVVAPVATPVFASFLRVLARHQRLDLLPQIYELSVRGYELQTGRRRVQVWTARPLSDDSRRKLEQSLARQFQCQPILDVRVEPRLLGGLVVQVGDTVFDGSLQTRLKQLRARLRERSLHEIQSGRDRFSHPA